MSKQNSQKTFYIFAAVLFCTLHFASCGSTAYNFASYVYIDGGLPCVYKGQPIVGLAAHVGLMLEILVVCGVPYIIWRFDGKKSTSWLGVLIAFCLIYSLVSFAIAEMTYPWVYAHPDGCHHNIERQGQKLKFIVKRHRPDRPLFEFDKELTDLVDACAYRKGVVMTKQQLEKLIPKDLAANGYYVTRERNSLKPLLLFGNGLQHSAKPKHEFDSTLVCILP